MIRPKLETGALSSARQSPANHREGLTVASPGKKSFPLRIDPVLWTEIERLAAQELRSANAQVEYLLREALARRGRRLPLPSANQQSPEQASDTVRQPEPD